MKPTFCMFVAFLLAGNSVAQKCKPLTVEFCSSLGYNTTYYKNLVEEQDQKAAEIDINFKDFLVLDGMGCSKLVKPLACSIYAPPCLEKYGSLPPCRSFCKTVNKQCRFFINAYKSLHERGALYCNLFPNADPIHGCIDWSIENGKYVMKVRGNPTLKQHRGRHIPKFLRSG